MYWEPFRRHCIEELVALNNPCLLSWGSYSRLQKPTHRASSCRGATGTPCASFCWVAQQRWHSSLPGNPSLAEQLPNGNSEYVWEQQSWIKGSNKVVLTRGCRASRSWGSTLQLTWAQADQCWLGHLLSEASGCGVLHKFLATGQTQPVGCSWGACGQFPPTHYPQVHHVQSCLYLRCEARNSLDANIHSVWQHHCWIDSVSLRKRNITTQMARMEDSSPKTGSVQHTVRRCISQMMHTCRVPRIWMV